MDATETEGASTAAATKISTEERADGQRSGVQELTAAEEKITRQLQDRDREVKTHEMAHLASAGQYARGGPTYSYQQGPDGRRYAVGGEVPIDVSQEKTPEETIQKMQAVKRAALAPAEPSSADRSIAASATALESQARQELQSEQANPAQGQSKPRDTAETNAEASEQPNEKAAPATRRSPSLHIVA